MSTVHYEEEDDEGSKLLKTIPPSARKRSINNTYSAVQEAPEVYRSRWRSIRVMYLTMFLSSVSFSICMSSLYPFLKIIDPDATTNFLGWVVAVYSVGQLIASPLFGAWSNFRRRSREPLLVSLIINILANVMYMYLEDVPNHADILMMVARGFVGFGAGNVAVVRSYLSAATTMSERTPAMSNMSAFQAIGFIVGPLIQTAMVPIGYPGPLHGAGFHFNMYTATALFSALVGVVNMALLFLVFKEHTVDEDIFDPASIQSDVNSGDTINDRYQIDCGAVIATIVLFFSVLFIFAVFETISTPLSMHMFAWTKAEATLYIGIMLGVAGLIAIFVFICIKIIAQRVHERLLLLGGFVICLMGFVIYLPWGDVFPAIQYATETTNATMANATMMATLHASPEDHEGVGCPYYYTWCYHTPAVRMWQFFLGTLFVAVGYPTCNVMSYTLFSKMLGPKPQGLLMGYLTATGSLARTLGPVYVSQIYDSYGPRVTFSSMIGLILMAIVGLLVVFRRIKPLQRTRTLTIGH